MKEEIIGICRKIAETSDSLSVLKLELNQLKRRLPEVSKKIDEKEKLLRELNVSLNTMGVYNSIDNAVDEE